MKNYIELEQAVLEFMLEPTPLKYKKCNLLIKTAMPISLESIGLHLSEEQDRIFRAMVLYHAASDKEHYQAILALLSQSDFQISAYSFLLWYLTAATFFKLSAKNETLSLPDWVFLFPYLSGSTIYDLENVSREFKGNLLAELCLKNSLKIEANQSDAWLLWSCLLQARRSWKQTFELYEAGVLEKLLLRCYENYNAITLQENSEPATINPVPAMPMHVVHQDFAALTRLKIHLDTICKEKGFINRKLQDKFLHDFIPYATKASVMKLVEGINVQKNKLIFLKALFYLCNEPAMKKIIPEAMDILAFLSFFNAGSSSRKELFNLLKSDTWIRPLLYNQSPEERKTITDYAYGDAVEPKTRKRKAPEIENHFFKTQQNPAKKAANMTYNPVTVEPQPIRVTGNHPLKPHLFFPQAYERDVVIINTNLKWQK